MKNCLTTCVRHQRKSFPVTFTRFNDLYVKFSNLEVFLFKASNCIKKVWRNVLVLNFYEAKGN